MRVLFDYQCFQMQKFGGVSNSYVQLIMQLQKMGLDTCIGMRDTTNHHLIQAGLVPQQSTLKRMASGILYRGGEMLNGLRQKFELDSKVYNHQCSLSQLEKQNFDVFEPTFFDPYFIPYLKCKPFVTTVHDMTLERLPDLSIDERQKAQKKVICAAASMLHCPSENTKKDIVDIYGIEPERVEVIYHGAPEKLRYDSKPLIDYPYLLYVGDRRSYKNFVPFVHEFAKLVELYPEIHLICTGNAFSKEEQKLLVQLQITDRVHQRRESDKGMANLYYNAVAFVYPSLYEGFGLPILEAYTYECPVILTPYSCFPEIAEDAAMYFEMKNGRSDFIDVFRKLYTMSREDRANLVAKGKERLAFFSWEQSAKKLINVYERLM